MGIGRSAAAEKSQAIFCRDLMPGSRRNEDAVAGPDLTDFSVDFHGACPFKNEINLLGQAMIMPLSRAPSGNAGLGEALVGDRRIGAVENAANRGAIGRGEWRLLIELLDGHG